MRFRNIAVLVLVLVAFGQTFEVKGWGGKKKAKESAKKGVEKTKKAGKWVKGKFTGQEKKKLRTDLKNEQTKNKKLRQAINKLEEEKKSHIKREEFLEKEDKLLAKKWRDIETYEDDLRAELAEREGKLENLRKDLEKKSKELPKGKFKDLAMRNLEIVRLKEKISNLQEKLEKLKHEQAKEKEKNNHLKNEMIKGNRNIKNLNNQIALLKKQLSDTNRVKSGLSSQLSSSSDENSLLKLCIIVGPIADKIYQYVDDDKLNLFHEGAKLADLINDRTGSAPIMKNVTNLSDNLIKTDIQGALLKNEEIPVGKKLPEVIEATKKVVDDLKTISDDLEKRIKKAEKSKLPKKKLIKKLSETKKFLDEQNSKLESILPA